MKRTISSWYLNYNSNLSQDHQNQITEQPRNGSWMSPASLSQNCPWMSPTTPQPNSNLNSQMNCNSTYYDRSYRTGNTNSTQSLQPCGRMSHLFNAVEFAVNRPTNHQEQTTITNVDSDTDAGNHHHHNTQPTAQTDTIPTWQTYTTPQTTGNWQARGGMNCNRLAFMATQSSLPY